MLIVLKKFRVRRRRCRDHPHTIDRWDDATGELLVEQIAADRRLPGRGRNLSCGGEALVQGQDHAAELGAGDRAELEGLAGRSKLSCDRDRYQTDGYQTQYQTGDYETDDHQTEVYETESAAPSLSWWLRSGSTRSTP